MNFHDPVPALWNLAKHLSMAEKNGSLACFSLARGGGGGRLLGSLSLKITTTAWTV
jgi:hypothetical protein